MNGLEQLTGKCHGKFYYHGEHLNGPPIPVTRIIYEPIELSYEQVCANLGVGLNGARTPYHELAPAVEARAVPGYYVYDFGFRKFVPEDGEPTTAHDFKKTADFEAELPQAEIVVFANGSKKTK